MARCPSCSDRIQPPPGVGSFTRCKGCSTPLWILEGEQMGRVLAPREKAPPSVTNVVGLHLGVFAAEVVLASTVLGLFVGLPILGFGRLFGFW